MTDIHAFMMGDDQKPRIAVEITEGDSLILILKHRKKIYSFRDSNTSAAIREYKSFRRKLRKSR